MTNFLIAPDFPPQHFAGWHLLNTYVQRQASQGLHLLTPSSAEEEYQHLVRQEVDVIYANPFDAAALIRQEGFIPVVRPIDKPDEMVIACGMEQPYQSIEDLQPGCKIVLTDNRDVKLIGLRLLEAADLAESDIEWQMVDSYQAAAKHLIRAEADAAFFLASAFHSLSHLTTGQIRTLIESHLADITHVVLVHPRLQQHVPLIQTIFLEMSHNPSGQAILAELGMQHGFEALSVEAAEFMIDLMDTLLD